MKRPTVVLKINPGLQIVCTFRDEESLDEFKTKAAEDYHEPKFIEVKDVRIFIGNTILIPKF